MVLYLPRLLRRRSIARNISRPNSASRSFWDKTAGLGRLSPLKMGKLGTLLRVARTDSFGSDGWWAGLRTMIFCSVKRIAVSAGQTLHTEGLTKNSRGSNGQPFPHLARRGTE